MKQDVSSGHSHSPLAKQEVSSGPTDECVFLLKGRGVGHVCLNLNFRQNFPFTLTCDFTNTDTDF